MHFAKLAFCSAAILVGGNLHLFAQSSPDKQPVRDAQKQINQVVIDAFEQSHDSWSSDEVILQPNLNEDFISVCRNAIHKLDEKDLSDVTDAKLNWTLMNLRKAGKLEAKASKRKKVDTKPVQHIAEIAARSVSDEHQCSIDRIMCDPSLRSQFDQAAADIDASLDRYTVRKAAFQLRKARKLRPELIGRVTDWGREIETHTLEELTKDPDLVRGNPGIYIFRDATGYLYIGQASNLNKRLKEHLDSSHNLSLADYLKSESSGSVSIEVHAFDPKSNASKVRYRRAYESELIASRKPRFNLQP